MIDVRRLLAFARADWRERSRRPAFLVLLAAGLWAAWIFVPAPEAAYDTFRIGDARGIYGSAWVGGSVALLQAVFFSLVGFYVVKNAIGGDRKSGVGSLLAATPMRNVEYALAKWVSGSALLGALTLVLLTGAALMQWVRGEDPVFRPLTLAAPFLWIALPAMTVSAALAVLFEAVPGLRGGPGNVVFFFFWAFALLMPAVELDRGTFWDPLGLRLLTAEMVHAGRTALPALAGASYSIGLNFRPAGPELATFEWRGIEWTPARVLPRLAWLVGAGLVAALAAVPFDRFAGEGSARPSRRSKRPHRSAAGSRDPGPAAAPGTPASAVDPAAPRPAIADRPLPPAARAFAPLTLLRAELRLFFAGAPVAWWVIWGALQIPGLFLAGPMAARFAALAWIWPVFRWSALGARDREHGTGALLDSSPHPVTRQLAAAWGTGAIAGLLAGAGFAIRGLIGGDASIVTGWILGALFVPALALAFGTLSGNTRTFEIVYLVLWYVGPLNGGGPVDFTGSSGVMPWAFLPVAAILLLSAGAARTARIRRG